MPTLWIWFRLWAVYLYDYVARAEGRPCIINTWLAPLVFVGRSSIRILGRLYCLNVLFNGGGVYIEYTCHPYLNLRHNFKYEHICIIKIIDSPIGCKNRVCMFHTYSRKLCSFSLHSVMLRNTKRFRSFTVFFQSRQTHSKVNFNL